MTLGSRRTTLLIATAAVALGALSFAGCGDDESPSDDITVPTIEAPTDATESAPATTTAPDSGGVSPGGGSGSGGTGTPDPSQEDSATNDKPPVPGSPEEAFEKACEANPAACG